MYAAVATNMQVVPAVDADDAELLDRRLGAVALAATDRDLELVRHPAAPAHPFDLYAEPGRILCAEAAPFGPDAGLHSAQRLAIGVPRHHPRSVEIGPHRGQILLLDPEDVESLAAGDLDHRPVIFFDDIGQNRKN